MDNVTKSKGGLIVFYFFLIGFIFFLAECKKPATSLPPQTQPPFVTSFEVRNQTINSLPFNSTGALHGINNNAVIQLSFSDKVDKNSVSSAISYTNKSQASAIPFNVSYQNSDSILFISSANIGYLKEYIFSVSTLLKSVSGKTLTTRIDLDFFSQIDSTDKFSRISDDALLDLIQQQTLKYFTDFGHPVSGMARERNSSNDVVTTGGTGFGIMGIISGVSRNFVSRTDGLNLITKMVSFLKNNCTSYHGAYSHWINGATGATVPFGAKDNGADIVETAYLLQGLLCARQFFNGADAVESDLRSNINFIWNRVEWNWFRQNNQDVLYWHWSPNYFWDLNFQVKGWNEALIVYALAASSNTDSIIKIVYHNGWANNGSIKNGNAYYGYTLPLGPPLGGPLFFAHYSFMGINPNTLTDTYADYQLQNVNHSKINYAYCVANPKGYYGYSNLCWGLTASDDQNGYSAHAPDNDNGTITPTAAISSLPYTPLESMNALKFFYYTLGDKIWKQYGFTDAFNLTNLWFADSFLAIDQGPEIVMIENYRTGLLWNLFMSCPEIKRGMKQIGFQSPNLQ
ncbi:MAG: glucoamylase family protein [Ginsengibacter sp.]